MLFLTGILVIGILLFLILTKKVSALAALALVPVVGALLAGFGLDTFAFAVEGIKSIAPVVAMFVFAILFFGVLTDAGMFDPIIDFILRMVGNHPARITVGAAVLAMIVHLDGSGAVTFLVAIPAMLPLFERMKMDRRVLACVVALGAGTMNLVPWGGPTLRAATALQVGVTDLYTPVIIPQLAGLLAVIIIAWFLGHREGRRLGVEMDTSFNQTYQRRLTSEEEVLRRPKMFWINIMLTILVIASLISGWVEPAMVFMLGAIIALLVNYRNLTEQKERIDAHAKASLLMASILLAAGVFTGIMKESGMISAIADQAATVIPESAGRFLPVILAVLSMPLSLVFDPDSFYFGFLPILAQVGSELGIEPVSMGQAAIMGQMTTGFPLSPLTATTFLLIGLAKVDLAEHQKFTFGYAFLITLVMTLVAILIGTIPF